MSHTKEQLSAALEWIERNHPSGIALVARALSETSPPNGTREPATCGECAYFVAPKPGERTGRCRPSGGEVKGYVYGNEEACADPGPRASTSALDTEGTP